MADIAQYVASARNWVVKEKKKSKDDLERIVATFHNYWEDRRLNVSNAIHTTELFLYMDLALFMLKSQVASVKLSEYIASHGKIFNVFPEGIQQAQILLSELGQILVGGSMNYMNEAYQAAIQGFNQATLAGKLGIMGQYTVETLVGFALLTAVANQFYKNNNFRDMLFGIGKSVNSFGHNLAYGLLGTAYDVLGETSDGIGTLGRLIDTVTYYVKNSYDTQSLDWDQLNQYGNDVIEGFKKRSHARLDRFKERWSYTRQDATDKHRMGALNAVGDIFNEELVKPSKRYIGNSLEWLSNLNYHGHNLVPFQRFRDYLSHKGSRLSSIT